MRWLSARRRRGTDASATTIDWRTVPAELTPNHPLLIDRLLDRSVDGLTVTEVLSPAECEQALSSLGDDVWTDIFFGGVVPMSLGMLSSDEPDRSRYYDDADRCRDLCASAFGFDLHERLAEVLAPMSSRRPLVPPDEDGRRYNPGQFRYWEPGMGGLKAHVGNEFRRELADFAMKHLLEVTSVKDHLSYFLVLQAPDRGGALSVYDVVWEQDSAEGYGWMGDRDDSAFDDKPCLRVQPEPGDVVIFGGGWRWHRVDPLNGKRARVTYGGFCAPSVNDRELHFWA